MAPAWMDCSMSDIVKYHAPWHQLKTAIVGRCYSEDFFTPIKNTQIRESLQQIAVETNEDYANISKTLESFGVEVARPSISSDLSIMDFVDTHGTIDYQAAKSFTLIPRPPMQPRDSILVVGNKVLGTHKEIEFFDHMIPAADKINLSKDQQFDAPLITVVGDTLIVDCREHDFLESLVRDLFPDYKIKPVYIGGHNDAVFCLPKPGVIIGTYHADNYNKTFPGWTVKHLENQSWNAIPGWRQIKHNNVNKWWAPESISNPEFSCFVDQWLSEWTGYVKETVFDVNMLSINESTILVNNYNRDLFAFFKQHGIEPVIVNFRHRFFWDGGIHCVTSDLYREGSAENYVA
jgi:hypothetical protein